MFFFCICSDIFRYFHVVWERFATIFYSISAKAVWVGNPGEGWDKPSPEGSADKTVDNKVDARVCYDRAASTFPQSRHPESANVGWKIRRNVNERDTRCKLENVERNEFVEAPVHPPGVLRVEKTAVIGGGDHKGEVDHIEGRPAEDVDENNDDQDCGAVAYLLHTLAREIVWIYPDDRLGNYRVENEQDCCRQDILDENVEIKEKVENKGVRDRSKEFEQGGAEAKVEADDEKHGEDKEASLPVRRWAVHRVADAKEPLEGDADGHPTTAGKSRLQDGVRDNLQGFHLALLEQVEEEEEGAEERDHEVDEGEDEEQAMEAVLDLGEHEEGEDVADTSNDADGGDVAFAEALDDKYGWVITEILTAFLREVHHHWNALIQPSFHHLNVIGLQCFGEGGICV